MKIYVASSWRNAKQPQVVGFLRDKGHEVYDFRHPKPGNDGFAWSAIDEHWQGWTAAKFRKALDHPVAQEGYGLDVGAMNWAEACVLVQPCGRSAHLEAGYMAGQGKRVIVLLEEHQEPELMYLLVREAHGNLVLTLDELEEELRWGALTTAQRKRRDADLELVDEGLALEVDGPSRSAAEFAESLSRWLDEHETLTHGQRHKLNEILEEHG